MKNQILILGVAVYVMTALVILPLKTAAFPFVDFGDGSDPALYVSNNEVVINQTRGAVVGIDQSGSLPVVEIDDDQSHSMGSLSIGDRVVIIQVTGNVVVNGSTGEAGIISVATVEDIYTLPSGNQGVELSNATVQLGNIVVAPPDFKVQLIKVPQYEYVNITNGGSITCPPWDGYTGGYLVFNSYGELSIEEGSFIDVSGKGFLPGEGGAGGAGSGPYIGGYGPAGTGPECYSGTNYHTGSQGGRGSIQNDDYNPGEEGETTLNFGYPSQRGTNLVMGKGGDGGDGGKGAHGGGAGGAGGDGYNPGGGPDGGQTAGESGGIGGDGGRGGGSIAISAADFELYPDPNDKYFYADGAPAEPGETGGLGGFAGTGGDGGDGDCVSNIYSGPGSAGGSGQRGDGGGGGDGGNGGNHGSLSLIYKQGNNGPVYSNLSLQGGSGGDYGEGGGFRAQQLGSPGEFLNPVSECDCYKEETCYECPPAGCTDSKTDECHSLMAHEVLMNTREVSTTEFGYRFNYTDGDEIYACNYYNAGHRRGQLQCAYIDQSNDGECLTLSRQYIVKGAPGTECNALFDKIADYMVANCSPSSNCFAYFTGGEEIFFGMDGTNTITYVLEDSLLTNGTLNCFKDDCENVCMGFDCASRGPDGSQGEDGESAPEDCETLEEENKSGAAMIGNTDETQPGNEIEWECTDEEEAPLMPTGLITEGEEKKWNMHVHPNPAMSYLTLHFELESSQKVEVQLIDLTGRIVFREDVSGEAGENKFGIDTRDIDHGVYRVVISKDNQTGSVPVVILD